MPDPEVDFISKVIEIGNISPAIVLGIQLDDFRRWRHVWNWIQDFSDEHGKAPDLKTLHETFDTLALVSAPEPLKHYADRLLWSSEKASYVDYVGALDGAIKEETGDRAKELTVDLYAKVACRSLLTHDIVASERVGSVADEVRGLADEFRNCLPTGLGRADDVFGGWGPGELVAICAPPYTGKTWTLIQSSKTLVAAGYKVLLLSCEMSPERVWRRFVARWFNIPWQKMLQGRIDDAFLKNLSKRVVDTRLPGELAIVPPLDMAGGGMGIIQRKVFQYAPDVLLIDSWADLIPPGHTSRWERILEMATELKQFAMQSTIPIVITHQVGIRGADKKEGARLHDVSGSYEAIAGKCDMVCILAGTAALRKTNELGVLWRKVRDYEPFGYTVRLNPNSGEDMVTVQNLWPTTKGDSDLVSDDMVGFDPSRVDC